MDILPIGNQIPSSHGALQKPAVAIETAPVKPAAPPVEQVSTLQQPDPTSNAYQVTQALRSVNKVMERLSPNLEFSIDEDSQRTIVKVVDRGTNEVIRQIPTEEVLDIAKALDQMKGLLISQKA